MATPPLTFASIPVALLCLSACGFVGVDELPASDSGVRDASVTDAGPDASTMDAFLADVPSDSAQPDAGLDAASDVPPRVDSGTDAGPCSQPRWGVSDDDTSDVAGDDFGRQIWTVRLCTVPALGEQLTLNFRARITAPGTMYDYDELAAYMWINGAGGNSSGVARTWAPVRVEGDTFDDYTLLLPADIDDDGIVDWVVGDNALEIEAWSNYNDRLSKTGIDSFLIMWP